MRMTMIEKILANHSAYDIVKPGEIIDLNIDIRVARDSGGPNVIRQLQDNKLSIADPDKTIFTFDAHHGESDEYDCDNIHLCKIFARDQGIRVFDIHSGIGAHLMIDEGLAIPGSTLVSSDLQVNILGAIGALGQGMGDKDITAAFSKGKVWFRVPKTIKINLQGKLTAKLTAKDIGLNLLSIFGSNKLLGYAVELTGDIIDSLSLDSRISLASMAAEMGAITFLMKPNQEVIDYCQYKSKKEFQVILPDEDAEYEDELNIDIEEFQQMVARPGKPAEVVPIEKVLNTCIDAAFAGTCNNGRIEDLRIIAGILKGRKVAPGILLKIVPVTDKIWTQSLQEGLIDIFKESGAIVSTTGPGGSETDMIKHSALGEVIISTGNLYYPGSNGRADVYLASPAIVAASSIAGFITHQDYIPEKPSTILSFPKKETVQTGREISETFQANKPTVLKGKVWYIPFDNIDTDMIYHNRYAEMHETSTKVNYTFSDLSGYEDFASKVVPGDIVVTGNNFGLGSSRQQAVDCFKVLGIQAIIAKSFAMIYERNAINAGLPIIVCSKVDKIQLQTGDMVEIDLNSGVIVNQRNNKSVTGEKFSNIQMEIYQRGGLFHM
jgi:3-isopropylmalate/(R)-2-methylmalate dehydratase large subunit